MKLNVRSVPNQSRDRKNSPKKQALALPSYCESRAIRDVGKPDGICCQNGQARSGAYGEEATQQRSAKIIRNESSKTCQNRCVQSVAQRCASFDLSQATHGSHSGDVRSIRSLAAKEVRNILKLRTANKALQPMSPLSRHRD